MPYLRKVDFIITVKIKVMEVKQKMNKDLPKGTKIVLDHSRNGLEKYDGEVFTVVDMVGGSYYHVTTPKTKSKVWSIYPDSGDSFHLLDRKGHAACLEAKVIELSKEIESLRVEITRLRSFESDEDEVASKLHKILTAKGTKDIAKILKELKSSNYL